LKTGSIEDAVGSFIDELSKSGLSVVPGRMSTLVAGESESVFRVVGECFERACRIDKIVLAVKFSNACPETAAEENISTMSVRAARELETINRPHDLTTITFKIDERTCTGCGICVQACPVGAITVGRVAAIDPETCAGCGICVAECPNEAIYPEGITPPPPSRVNHTLAFPVPATRAATPPTVPGGADHPSVFQQLVQGGGLLKLIFDLFRSPSGQGGGQGVRQGGGRGRRKGGGRGRGQGGGRGRGKGKST